MRIKEIFSLASDALRERKARSALTILMVIVGSSLMIALNGMSAGQSAFVNQQLNSLAPNILFASSGQRPFVEQVIPGYQGQVSLSSEGNFVNAPVLALDPTKIFLIDPNLQMVDGSTIRSNDPSAMLVGDSIANPPGMTTAFLTVGQVVRATTSVADPATGQLNTVSKSFIVSGIIQPTGNNQIDRNV